MGKESNQKKLKNFAVKRKYPQKVVQLQKYAGLDKKIKIHYLPGGRKKALILFGVIINLSTVYLLWGLFFDKSSTVTDKALIFIFLYLFFSISLHLFNMAKATYMTSAKGIEVIVGNRVIKTGWSNVERLVDYYAGGKRGVESLYLKNPYDVYYLKPHLLRNPISKLIYSFLFLIQPRIKRIIPLDAYSDSWRWTDLGKEIQRYAPQILEKRYNEQIIY